MKHKVMDIPRRRKLVLSCCRKAVKIHPRGFRHIRHIRHIRDTRQTRPWWAVLDRARELGALGLLLVNPDQHHPEMQIYDGAFWKHASWPCAWCTHHNFTIRTCACSNMKLAVTIDPPQNGIHFTPTEEVHGCVELQAREKTKMPMCITVCFQGDAARRSPMINWVKQWKLGLTCSLPTAIRQGQRVVDTVSTAGYAIADSRAKSLQKDLHSVVSPAPSFVLSVVTSLPWLTFSAQLFDMSRVVFLTDPNNAPGKTTARPEQNQFSARFTFVFPPHPSCCGRKAKTTCLLPPTLNICSAGLRATATYSISALACRAGLLRRNLRASAQLKYLPAAVLETYGGHPCPELIQKVAMLPAGLLGWPDKAVSCLSLAGCLPAYSPALTLEILMPYPGTLCIGRGTMLQIFLHASSNLLGAVGPLQLRSAEAMLRSTTTSRVGSMLRTDVTYRSMWRSAGAVTIAQEKFKVDCGIWKDVQVPEFIGVSFNSCAVSREYAVEVTLGISSQRQLQTQVRTTFGEVRVRLGVGQTY